MGYDIKGDCYFFNSQGLENNLEECNKGYEASRCGPEVHWRDYKAKLGADSKDC